VKLKAEKGLKQKVHGSDEGWRAYRLNLRRSANNRRANWESMTIFSSPAMFRPTLVAGCADGL